MDTPTTTTTTTTIEAIIITTNNPAIESTKVNSKESKINKLKIITSGLNGVVSKESDNTNGRIQYYINKRKQIDLME